VSLPSGEETVPPGQLGPEARTAATQAAIRLLGTYFADAPTWELEHRADVSTGESDDDLLARSLRLRIALSAARRLDTLLREIGADLSFRYRRVEDEIVGMVRGRLDVQRYLRSQGKREAPRRYPVVVVERSHATPENVLAIYATGWVLRELDVAEDVVLPPNSPERREVRERRLALARTLNHPVLAEARTGAESVWRSGHLEGLLDSVEARVIGGHLARPEPYGALVDWVRTFDPQGLPETSDVEWSFYDERFDTKLFEIWMLDRLERALAPKLGDAVSRPLWDHGASPTFLWKQGLATVALHFQRALSSGVGQTVWRRLDPPVPFDGVPDITVVISTARSGESLAYVDAKLRQRDHHPTEELYKLLGYFDNTGSPAARRGAIVYYNVQSVVVETFEDGNDGQMLSVGVGPVSGDHELGFARIADMLMDMLRRSDETAFTEPADRERDLDEAQVAAVQEKAVSDILIRASRLPSKTLDPYRHLLSQQIPETWPQFDDELSTIVVTAYYFGASAPPGADLSGPLLGLSAACERVLCGPGALFDRVASRAGDILRRPITLGTAAMCLKWCVKPKRPEDHEIRALVEAEAQANYEALTELRADLFTLNNLRKAAAHLNLVPQAEYTAGHVLILGSGEQAKPGLLTRLVQLVGVL
jgi:hypothetical protein